MVGLRYDQSSRGILHFATDGHDFEVLARSAEALRALGVERHVMSLVALRFLCRRFGCVRDSGHGRA